MTELTKRRCRPCEGGMKALDTEHAHRHLEELHEDWRLDEAVKEISRDFRFRNFHETMSFANAVAWIANSEDHHPDLELGYRHCRVRYTTHAIGGLSDNDFICAAKIDALLG